MKKLLGFVGVDSGQLIICDPCYIDSQWKQVPFYDVRIYKHKTLNKLFGYNQDKLGSFKVEPFSSYDQRMSTNISMNDMIENHEVVQLEMPEKIKLMNSFSYGGICETTMNKQHQINFELGHPGVAVAFNSGYGDGLYPVYGTFNREGRCVKVEIDCNPTQNSYKSLKYAKQSTKKRPKKNPKK